MIGVPPLKPDIHIPIDITEVVLQKICKCHGGRGFEAPSVEPVQPSYECAARLVESILTFLLDIIDRAFKLVPCDFAKGP